MSRPVAEGTLLHTPSPAAVASANLTRYQEWLAEHHDLRFETYHDLWAWSVGDLDAFWGSVWDFFTVQGSRPLGGPVLAERSMPGARWFPGTELNYVDQALRWDDDRPAVIFRSERRPLTIISHRDLRQRVAATAAGLARLGVGRGDRVVAYAPNIPETLVAFLAAASLGAVWSACSPDFGVAAVADRFRQIEPKVLVAADGYRYAGVDHDRGPLVAQLAASLPTLEAVVAVDNIGKAAPLPATGRLPRFTFADLEQPGAELAAVPVPFDHPLWVLYSSGTTGLPKAIVHGHGGIVLEHLKALAFHHDLGRGDRFFWYTSTGWMMWNLLVGGLLVGGCVVLYDGSPAAPDLGTLWRLADQTGTTSFGTSAAFIEACAKAGITPRRHADLTRVRAVGSTGSPLSADGFAWVYEHVGRDVHLGSASGGTDVCTAFVGPCPLLPVRAGEIQCRYLGAAAEAWDPAGRPMVGRLGELVLTEPMPSMPVGFWGDDGDRRYRESYFATYPGVWRHGDWVRFDEQGGCVITGRSDSTLNRGGVRTGTAELYRVVEAVDGVADSLAVDTGSLGTEGGLLLFVVPVPGRRLDDDLREAIVTAVRRDLSPRHVPDEIHAVAAVPRTLNGKKLEVPVKRILAGEAWTQAASPDAVADPSALLPFVELARQRATGGA